MTEIAITPPQVIEVTATSPTAYTITVTQPAAVTVTAALGNVGDMTKAVYDTDNDGVVDNSKALGGVAASGFVQTANASWVDLTDGGATSLHSHTNDHARQHSITSTSDHTSTATSGQMLQADANGLPVNATNTDAQVSAAVTASHAAVTVADSASIDMTLTGQQISAAAIFGTGAGVVAEGNHTHYSYYSLQWAIITGWSPVDSTTYYISGKGVQDGNAARGSIYIPVSGTIVYADFNSYVGTTLASAETSSAWVRLNNTTDTLISDAIQQDAVYEQFVNSALSIAVTAGNYVEIKWTTPAWVTNPTNTRQYGFIVVRV